MAAKDGQPSPRRGDTKQPADEPDSIGYRGVENLYLGHLDEAYDKSVACVEDGLAVELVLENIGDAGGDDG